MFDTEPCRLNQHINTHMGDRGSQQTHTETFELIPSCTVVWKSSRIPCELEQPSNNSRMRPLSYVVWLSTSCEWQSPRHRNHSDPHLNILKAQIKWQATEEKHTSALGWVKTSRFTESSWRKTSFDVSNRLYLKNILMLCRGPETIHMLTGTRYMYEIVLTGNSRTGVGGASNWTDRGVSSQSCYKKVWTWPFRDESYPV